MAFSFSSWCLKHKDEHTFTVCPSPGVGVCGSRPTFCGAPKERRSYSLSVRVRRVRQQTCRRDKRRIRFAGRLRLMVGEASVCGWWMATTALCSIRCARH